MKVRTADLIGAQLDWAVAKCEGYDNPIAAVEMGRSWSTDWSQAGPIIEREKIEVRWVILDSKGGGYWWTQNLFTDTYGRTGTTPLIAAMRCYTASKLGDEVDVPEELT